MRKTGIFASFVCLQTCFLLCLHFFIAHSSSCCSLPPDNMSFLLFSTLISLQYKPSNSLQKIFASLWPYRRGGGGGAYPLVYQHYRLNCLRIRLVVVLVQSYFSAVAVDERS